MAKDERGFPKNAPRKKPKPIVEEPQKDAPVETGQRGSLGLSPERLWEAYSIKADWSLDKQIEMLVVMWNLEVEEIAEILDLENDFVKTQLVKLEDSWRDLGRNLSPEERILALGRHIAELERLRAQLEEAYVLTKDPKYLTQKTNVLERISKLRRIDQRSPEEEGDKGSSLKAKIDAMPAEKNRALLERLRASDPTKTEP